MIPEKRTEVVDLFPLVLYVDDEQPNLNLFRRTLDDELAIMTASSAAEAYRVLEREEVGVLVSDHRMPDVTGIELLNVAAVRWPDVSRVLLTAYSDRDLLLAAIREGRVHDYILKPWVADDLRLRLARALDLYRERRSLVEARVERDVLRAEVPALDDHGPLLGVDAGLRALVPQLDELAVSSAPVIIFGEEGSGRAALARELHRRGPRAEGPFVLLRCGRGDLARRLIGDAGADPGALRRARHGSLHLGDVEALSSREQQQLLEALDALGPDEAGAPRVTASSQVSIATQVSRGRFDQGLATRLTARSIEMPPLRKHSEDVAALATHFLALHARRLDKDLGVSHDALSALRGYDWPGNVRELANLVERAATLAERGTQLEREDFIMRLDELPPPSLSERPAAEASGSVYDEIEREEGARLRAVLKQALGNKARAARILGIARTTLNDRLRKYGVE